MADLPVFDRESDSDGFSVSSSEDGDSETEDGDSETEDGEFETEEEIPAAPAAAPAPPPAPSGGAGTRRVRATQSASLPGGQAVIVVSTPEEEKIKELEALNRRLLKVKVLNQRLVAALALHMNPKPSSLTKEVAALKQENRALKEKDIVLKSIKTMVDRLPLLRMSS